MANRKAAESFILNCIKELTLSDENVNIYKTMFATMSDEDFDQYMKDIESGKKWLVIFAPHNLSTRMTTKNNIELGKKLGHKFFQKIWIGKTDVAPAHLTPVEYLVVDLPVRRQSQLLTKKISIPEHNKSKDLLTGQATGDSKGSKISFPEVQMLASMGLDACTTELIKYRGGDNQGFRAMNTMIARYGNANLETLKHYAGGVDSTRLLRTYLTGMMLKNNL